MLKAVILIGGPQKGTRFRPLSLDLPKPLFPIAGRSIIAHHIEACVEIKELREILIIGFYAVAQMERFVEEQSALYAVSIRYLQEFTMLGTAGGMYHFRDQIRAGNPTAFFVLNGDVCSDFPLCELYEFHKSKSPQAMITIMSTEATKQQSLNYGSLVIDALTGSVNHYVEKPSSYVSTFINCGIYICSLDVFAEISQVFRSRELNGSMHSRDQGYIEWEREVLTKLAGTRSLFALPVNNWWSQIKTAGSAIYANRRFLDLYRRKNPKRLASNDVFCTVIGDVFIHPTATIHPTAVLGPNVSIGAQVTIGAGVRVHDAIILEHAVIKDHTLIMHSIGINLKIIYGMSTNVDMNDFILKLSHSKLLVGRSSKVGSWARIEGTPTDPDPNKPFAKMENPSLFNSEGKLNPSISILGCFVIVPSEKILLNSIVLPHKELTRSYKNEIIL